MKKSNPTLYWVHCPICHNKTRTKVREDTVLINFSLYCPVCKNTTLVNVVRLKKVVTIVEQVLFLRNHTVASF